MAADVDIARLGPGTGSLPPRSRLRTDAPEQSLDGAWSFRLSRSLRSAPDGWHLDVSDQNAPGWERIPVPGHWNLCGFALPAYSNVQMPFPVDPPHPPDENQIGDYRLVFDLDPAVRAHRRHVLRFDGIESAAEIWLNGVPVGTTRGSRLTHEFDVSAVVRERDNVLAVRVAQFSDATYIENQDMWWLPGIFRSVTLLARPDGGIDDVHVIADYDHVSGRGRLHAEVTAGQSARLRIGSLGVDVELPPRAGIDIDIDAVRPWSAERPELYEATVSTSTETVSLRLGFRRVAVADAVLTVNGAPIMLRGVNRHEHHPERGRVFDRDAARAELLLMKRHNINAIRTSHYPPHPDTLDLFDELGFWVIDECDLESHGFEHVEWFDNPSANPAWREAYLDRMRRTVHRDKNHVSVIMWSLGNEAYEGENMEAMASWTRTVDPSRLIHYEGDRKSRYVDVYSRMYATHAEVEQIGEESLAPPPWDADADEMHRLSLPFLQCEFAHAMGTGPGGLDEYWDLFERYPRLAGGFVWEWAEQALAVIDEGERRFRYGGDFGERVHDGSFVLDGLVDADRTPRPGLMHYAAVIAPVKIAIDPLRSRITVENRFDFVDLVDEVRLRWYRSIDGAIVDRGELAVPTCAPRERAQIPLPAGAATRRTAATADVVTVEAVTAENRPWAPAGHCVSSADDVRLATPAAPVAPAGTPLALRFADPSGTLVGLGDLPLDGISVGFWRAPTDNDLDIGDDEPDLPSLAARWREAGVDRAMTRVRSLHVGDEHAHLSSRTGTPIRNSAVDAELRWSAVSERAVRLDARLEPVGTWTDPWARLGLDLVVDSEPLGVRFAGRGPVPSYPDLQAAARFGWYELGLDELVVPHVVPQESGSRLGVVDATVVTAAGSLRVRTLSTPFALTVSPFDRLDVAAATHDWKLRPDGRTHISIDLAQSGVGTATCGPGILPRYRLTARPLSISLLLEHTLD